MFLVKSITDETSPVLESRTIKKGICVSVYVVSEIFQRATTLLLQRYTINVPALLDWNLHV